VLPASTWLGNTKVKVLASVSVQKLIKAAETGTVANPPGLLTIMLKEAYELLDSGSAEPRTSLAMLGAQLENARSGAGFCRGLRAWNVAHEELVALGAALEDDVPTVDSALAELSRKWLRLERTRLLAVRRGDGLASSRVLDPMYKLEQQIDASMTLRARRQAAE
jgi:hypothetical protein